MLDAFAGSGALGFEALSRGVEEAVFVEADPAAAETVRSNAEALGVLPRCRVHRGDVVSLLERGVLPGPFTLVLADPPWREEVLPTFLAALTEVAGHLAREIVRGGEGATKLVTVRVTGAASPEDARLAARAISNSPLVKTAIHGGDPNWGRLVSAAGRSGAAFVLDHASVTIGDVELFKTGVPHDDRVDEAARVLADAAVTVRVDLGTGGPHAMTMWTCDFSAEYVRINAEYRT